MTPRTSPEPNIKKSRIDELDEPPLHELPPSLSLCSPTLLPLALAGQVRHTHMTPLHSYLVHHSTPYLYLYSSSLCLEWHTAGTHFPPSVSSSLFPSSPSSPSFSLPLSTGWGKFACKYFLNTVSSCFGSSSSDSSLFLGTDNGCLTVSRQYNQQK